MTNTQFVPNTAAENLRLKREINELRLRNAETLKPRGWKAVADEARRQLARIADAEARLAQMTPETRVKRAALMRASAMQEYRDAIRAAHEAGLSTREIAKHAGVSQVAVVKMLNR